MWLVAALLNNTELQYFVSYYLLFFLSQRYVFIALKGNSFICAFDSIQSTLLWNLRLLQYFSLVYFSIFLLHWLISTHFEHIWVSFIQGRKSYPLVTLPGCQARPLFPLLLLSWRVVCASCVLCITSCSPLTVRYWQRSPVSLQLPDPLASFFFFLLDFNYWHCDHLGLNQILPLPLPSWLFSLSHSHPGFLVALFSNSLAPLMNPFSLLMSPLPTL